MGVPKSYKETQNTIFLLSFCLLTVFSAMRLFSSLKISGSRRVITYFNSLIFASALLRVVFCIIPYLYHLMLSVHDLSEDVYMDTIYGRLSSHDRMNPSTSEKLLVLVSEIILSIGNWSLYGVFILIACYWAYMLKKLYGTRMELGESPGSGAHYNSSTSPVSGPTPTAAYRQNNAVDLYGSSVLHTNRFISEWTRKFDSIELFNRILTTFLCTQTICYILYLYFGILTDLLLYDALLLSSTAVIVLLAVTYLSSMINQVLHTMEQMNKSAAQAQLHRIHMIIRVANVFFYTRVILEGSLAAYLWYLILGEQSHDILVPEPYWTIYIGIKHSTEIIVLILELLVSTAIRSYENPKVNLRQVPKLFKPGFSYHSIESEIEREEDDSSGDRDSTDSWEIEMGHLSQRERTNYGAFPVSTITTSLEETRPILNSHRR